MLVFRGVHLKNKVKKKDVKIKIGSSEKGSTVFGEFSGVFCDGWCITEMLWANGHGHAWKKQLPLTKKCQCGI